MTMRDLAERMGDKPIFWRVRMADIVTVITIVGSIFGFFLSYDHRLIEVESNGRQTTKNQLEIVESLKQVTDHVDRMDREGTLITKATATERNAAIANLTNQMTALIPRIERMDANIGWISDLLKSERREVTPKHEGEP